MTEGLPTNIPLSGEQEPGFADPALTDSQLGPIGSGVAYVETDPAVTLAPGTRGEPTHLSDPTTASLRNTDSEGNPAEQPTEAKSEIERKLALAEQWLATQTKQFTTDHDLIKAAEASGEPVPAEFEQTEPVPEALASEVALLAQKRVGLWGKHDIMLDKVGGDVFALKVIRDQALDLATELAFGVIQYSNSWALRVQLNAMHEKFTNVRVEDLAAYLAGDDDAYEYKELFIRNIVADHAPELLTENMRVLMDPSQPLWRVASTHASILFRNRPQRTLATYGVDQMPVALPVGGRSEYIPEDDEVMKPISDMSDDELALYCTPQAIPEVRERGRVLFKELNLPARETLLTRRFFEMSAKSKDLAVKERASDRNRSLEGKSILEEGDFVHATFTPKVLEQMLDHGLQCGEAVMDNTRSQVNYPFTVSFLKVNKDISSGKSVPERLDKLGNAAYGSINLVLSRDSSSTDYGKEQVTSEDYQHQIFGGVPSTEIKGIIIRERIAPSDTIENVVDEIVKNGMFIPVYSGSTGELIFSSEQYDQLRVQATRA